VSLKQAAFVLPTLVRLNCTNKWIYNNFWKLSKSCRKISTCTCIQMNVTSLKSCDYCSNALHIKQASCWNKAWDI